MMPRRPVPSIFMIAISLASALILLLSACGTPTNSSSTSSSSAAPVKGGTWVDDLYEEPDSLIPNASTETFSDMVDQAIYTPIFYGDSNGTLHPGLASEMPTVANGGSVRTIKRGPSICARA